MALHPEFPQSKYAELLPEHRWFRADETLRSTAREKLLPPLVARIRDEVHTWRSSGYVGASATSLALLRWWFSREHLLEAADGTLEPFRYYFAQREAVEAVIWLHEIRQARERRDRALDLTSAQHTYPAPGKYVVAVKVIDIFGNDTTSLLSLTVG